MTDSLDTSDDLITIITGVIYISIHQSGYRHFINDLGRQKAPKTGTLFVPGTFRLSGKCLRRERGEMVEGPENRGCCWTPALRRLD